MFSHRSWQKEKRKVRWGEEAQIAISQDFFGSFTSCLLAHLLQVAANVRSDLIFCVPLEADECFRCQEKELQYFQDEEWIDLANIVIIDQYEQMYLRETAFGMSDQAPIALATSIHSNREEFFWCRHNERGVCGVTIALPLHLSPLLVAHPSLIENHAI